MILNNDLDRQLVGDKVSSHKLFWKVTFLFSLFQLILALKPCSTALCCQYRLLPAQDSTAWSTPSHRRAPVQDALQVWPKLTLSTPQILLRLPEYWSTAWPCSCLGRGKQAWVGILLLSSKVAQASHQVCVWSSLQASQLSSHNQLLCLSDHLIRWGEKLTADNSHV